MPGQSAALTAAGVGAYPYHKGIRLFPMLPGSTFAKDAVMDTMPSHPPTPSDLIDQALPSPEVPAACLGFDTELARRLACAKARLDRLERDSDCRDFGALGMARIEFAQASRAVADELLARGLG